MHPEGMLTIGTKSGKVIIFEPITVVFDLNKTKKIKTKRKNYLLTV